MSTQVQEERTAAPWPLPRRVVAGVMRPGGPAMVARALEGAGLGDGDRVVELAPGLGLTAQAIVAAGPRSWTGVEPDPLGAEHLRKALRGAGREVRTDPVDATGLPDGAASIVVTDALLSTLNDAGRAAVIAEAARLLGEGGRLVLHELAPAAGADPAAIARLADAGLEARTEEAWRADVERAGLVTVGSLVGRLDLPEQPDLMKEAGPRGALRITRALATDAGVRTATLATRNALERDVLALRSVVVVAEVPLILGMRRRRR
ncbi:MAG: class I SAM-dependent methyltransferase [Thermoleophilia bacterium]